MVIGCRGGRGSWEVGDVVWFWWWCWVYWVVIDVGVVYGSEEYVVEVCVVG